MKVNMKELKFQNKALVFEFDLYPSFRQNYEFAYYLYQNGRIIQRVWYQKCQKHNELFITPTYSGTYQIRLFIRNEEKVMQWNELSNLIHLNLSNQQLLETTLEQEKIFYSDVPVKYLFQKAKGGSKQLVISFSGLYSTEFKGGAPVYNHIRTLDPVDTNKLFILDSYKNQFCYYVGFGGAYDYERSVIALITTIANKEGISPENIIATGSSKGGTAALYYSLKYYFGKAIIGAPQIYIADYLNRRATSPSMRERFTQLMGPDEKYGFSFWNQLIFNQVELTEKFPELYFHVGEGDFHYPEHLKPLLTRFSEKSVTYQLDLGDYDNHSETGTYFTPFLLKQVEEIIERNTDGGIK
ncbi:esterase family protein [Listeria aquatica]|uniref:Esterase family protein n=1 Tax=Listeria aquatica TaxID=1494960 RepID=A0A841ZKU2_9LIST|nr:hypothetical protein [Listeria aquatica]MBC1521309.1 esterase family protein [Listeria aquatica]